MTTGDELVSLMNNRASRILAGVEGVYQVGIETAAFGNLSDTDPEAYAPSAASSSWFYISELADAPWGPQSMDQCEATLIRFARAWLELEDKSNSDVQAAFFDHWTATAEDLIRKGRRVGWKWRQKRLVRRLQKGRRK